MIRFLLIRLLAGAVILTSLVVSGEAFGQLIVTPAVDAGGMVTLTWSPVPNATSYNVYRSRIVGTDILIATRVGAGVNSPFSEVPASPSTTFYYRVTAVIGGTEVQSNEVIVVTPARRKTVGTFDFDTNSWCEDDGTFCWNRTSKFFSGVRLIFEPKFGTIIQDSNDKIEEEDFSDTLPGLGFEINVWEAWVSFQVVILDPNTVKYDEASPIRSELISTEGNADVDYGYSIGLSLFDGIVAIGQTKLKISGRSFNDTRDREVDFFYITLQPISTVRSVGKRAQK